MDFLCYSQAVLVDKTLYISGQLGLDTQTGSLVPGGVEAEAKKALDNMGYILEAAGASYKNGEFSQVPLCTLGYCYYHYLLSFLVVKTTVLLADINDFGKVNDIYRQCKLTFQSNEVSLSEDINFIDFSDNFPARAAYQVAALPRVNLI